MLDKLNSIYLTTTASALEAVKAKADANAASQTMIVTGGTTIYTFDGIMKIGGLVIAVAGLVIGYLNWKESKRRTDVMDRANKLKEIEIDAKTNNSTTK